MDYKKNAKYFRPATSIKAIVIGAIIAVILLMANLTIGIIACLAVVAVAYLIYSGKPSDEDIDREANEELQKLKAAALKKLGVEDDEISFAEPIQFRGWNFVEDGSRILSDRALTEAWDVLGKDGRWRSPIIGLYFFAFSEHMVHYYYRYKSMVSDTYKEGTDEFSYNDVVSAKTDTEDLPSWDFRGKREDPVNRVRWDSFKLTTTGGTSVVCSVMDSAIADTSVNAMRSLLKQKKIQR